METLTLAYSEINTSIQVGDYVFYTGLVTRGVHKIGLDDSDTSDPGTGVSHQVGQVKQILHPDKLRTGENTFENLPYTISLDSNHAVSTHPDFKKLFINNTEQIEVGNTVTATNAASNITVASIDTNVSVTLNQALFSTSNLTNIVNAGGNSDITIAGANQYYRIVVTRSNSNMPIPSTSGNDFFYFVKDPVANTAGISGYYASVKLKLDSSASSGKNKLYAVSLGATVSSK
jgi:hypothetical protein